MDVSRIGGQNSISLNKNVFTTDAKNLLNTNKLSFPREPINDNFSRSREATPSYTSGETIDRYEARKAVIMSAIEKATGEEKKDLEMRLYYHEYSYIFSGRSSTGWGIESMDTMYSQATEIYKQIEESSDSEETKVLKFKALENALSTGTGMYKMRMVGEKMKADALEAEAQGKTIDRSYRSKAKFDKLSAMSGAYQNITSMFFNNLKNGKGDGVDYGAMISDVTRKIMSYKHTN